MNKRLAALLSLLLCAGMLLSVILPVRAEEPEEAEQGQTILCEIHSAEDLTELAERCRLDSFSRNLEVRLMADIDLTGVDFAGIPIFSGRFEGNGHTISGLSITAEGSNLGLFRYLTQTAVVRELNVKGEVQPQGSRCVVGGIAGSSAGQILSCSFSGTVSGGENVGGITGRNTLTGVIEDCRSDGEVYGTHFVGGMAGENLGVIRSCVNTMAVNTTSRQNTVELSDITLESLMDTESANTVTDIGGIAGESTGVIRGCENRGNVGYKHMGYNIGGIAGTQSGYLANCKNSGQVSGRKEVGGIVGQMEPMALVEYDEDALQILQEQLNAMSQITSRTAANMRNSASEITAQVAGLQDNIDLAKDALDTLLPDKEDPTLPDMDTLMAAQNALSGSLTDMKRSLEGMSSTTQSAMGTLNNNLNALQNQISAMSQTLGNVSDTLGGSITDVSDLDTELDLTGKVAGCVNTGAVLADRNVGGIAGAMALENDLDPEDDMEILGESSLNFESRLRAVLLDCDNSGEVTGSKQSVGGIVGWMSLGLTKNCRNTGPVNGENADCVGGIVGKSTGYVRGNSAKCALSGDVSVGGIAGSGTIVTGCRSMVSVTGGSEKLGAILGINEESTAEEENPIADNYYLTVGRDLGGIDGISYSGMAEPLSMEDFFRLEELPEMFRKITVSFRFEDGTVKTISVPTGGSLSRSQIPKLPEKEGCTASWKGLETLDLETLTFDALITASYTPLSATIACETQRGGLPVLLLEGAFGPEVTVSLTEPEALPGLEPDQTLLEAWSFRTSEDNAVETVRFLLPEDCAPDRVRVLLPRADGTWTETETDIQGSYITFSPEAGETRFALIQLSPPRWPWIAGGAGIAVLLAAAVGAALYRRAKKKKAAKQSDKH